MKNIVSLLNLVVQCILLLVLFFDRKIYLHCVEHDN